MGTGESVKLVFVKKAKYELNWRMDRTSTNGENGRGRVWGKGKWYEEMHFRWMG